MVKLDEPHGVFLGRKLTKEEREEAIKLAHELCPETSDAQINASLKISELNVLEALRQITAITLMIPINEDNGTKCELSVNISLPAKNVATLAHVSDLIHEALEIEDKGASASSFADAFLGDLLREGILNKLEKMEKTYKGLGPSEVMNALLKAVLTCSSRDWVLEGLDEMPDL
jgi:hypothetical protein